MKEETYLVTGGAGFIGSHIVALLVEKGAGVRVLDDFSTGFRRNLDAVEDDIELVEGDVRDEKTVRAAVSGCAYVIHQAALPSVVRSIEDPLTVHRVNVDGTLGLLLAARDAGVRRFVFASSSSVYGDNPALPKREDMMPMPLSPYAVGKLVGEHYCSVFSRLYGLTCVSLRYFNVFGPRQNPESQYAAVIPKFFTALLKGEAPTVHGDGEQSRDFTFVRNVAEANLLACTAPVRGGEVLNIACGRRTTLNELLRLVRAVCGVDIPARYGPPRPGDVRHSLADISRARRTIGYEPAVDLEEGLRRITAYYRTTTHAGDASRKGAEHGGTLS